MTRNDYERLAYITGVGFAIAARHGGEDARSEYYEHSYRPLVDYLNENNPRFDQSRFCFAVAKAESAYLEWRPAPVKPEWIYENDDPTGHRIKIS